MDSDAETDALAPALAPDEHADQPRHARAVKQVTGGGPIQYGEAVQFELAFADGSREQFRAACEDFPKIVSELRGFASITERARAASRVKPVEVVNPYQATEARTDRVGSMIVVRFPTMDGLPLLVAMEASVAETLMLGLERELTRGPRR
jgi:hypothetical protein